MEKMTKLMVLSGFALLSACGPGIEITRPAADGYVAVPEQGKVEISVDVEGWKLREPGLCGQEPDCGHLAVQLVEEERSGTQQWTGSQCGDELVTTDTTFALDLATCSRQTGDYSVTVRLNDDRGQSRSGSGVTAIRRFVVEPE